MRKKADERDTKAWRRILIQSENWKSEAKWNENKKEQIKNEEKKWND